MHSKVAIITGGGSGIGRATVERFLREGARVALADIVNVDATIAALGGPSQHLIGVTVDIGDEAAVTELFARTVAVFGRLDVLVNCAGIGTPRPITIADATAAEFDELLRVNVKGTFYCCRAAIPLMRAVGGGAIVNVASEL